MFCQLPFPVFRDHTSDLFHSFNDKHLRIPKIIFRRIAVFMKKCIILRIKGVYCIEKTSKMIVNASTPNESITACIGFNLCAVDKKLFERNKTFFSQATHKLVIQFVQHFTSQLFVLKFVKSISLRLLAFGQPDKSEVSFA